MSNDIVERTALELIAAGDHNTITNCNNEFEKSKIQMNIFLVEQARRELQTIVKYTKLLDKLQDKYEKAIVEFIDDDKNKDQFITALPYFINQISKCIDRSNNIIKEVLGDDKLSEILYIDMSQNINNDNSVNNYLSSNLSDPQSRQKVRNTIDKILSQIQNNNNEE